MSGLFRRNKLPYSLINPDSIVIQIGAPSDTLHAGRARSMHFARLTSPRGHAVVMEPDPASAAAFTMMASEFGLTHCDVVEAGAWSRPERLRFRIDPAHPATNFTEGRVQYDAEELTRYEVVEIEARPVDEVVAELGLPRVDLVSITTNGAESEILAGMAETMAMGLRYVSLARTDDGYIELMREYGFAFLGHDDRGFTFCRDSGQ